MALYSSSVNPSTTSSSCSFDAPHSLCFLRLQPQTHSSRTCRPHRFRVSGKTVQIEAQQPHKIKVAIEPTKKKRKPKPSFFQQIQDKWSMKVDSPRDKLPWQKQQELDEEEEKESPQSEITVSKPVIQEVSFSLPNPVIHAPWAHRSKPITPQVDSEPETHQRSVAHGENLSGFGRRNEIDATSGAIEAKKIDQEFDGNGKWEREIDEISVGVSKSFEVKFDSNGKLGRETDGSSVGVSKKEETVIPKGLFGVAMVETLSGDSKNDENVETLVPSGSDSGASVRLPWEREGELGSGEGDKIRKKWSNTLSAESLLPEHELRRLRNISLRMLERTKVGAVGITQALVDAIHEKWKVDEVVKLKFEEPLSLNMRRTHGILEVSVGTLLYLTLSSVSIELFNHILALSD